ncbi:SagB-type dehydrogenase domain-containing protein [Pseudovibrio denitrificans]|uniref:SagB-type dehydrogenase domain-containing protein n=1 Tax=Pseudovibrio denitrificans TaxID=258256 RepID=A0A1I7DZJ8_9HYPH|nr:SagB family peptide dehydrogenase [Pseudovibrio denitrificans]SFU17084.1 SagB-type dehydrogenase domain-containing protein [Pseudovibrio denitrificans]
MHEIVQHIASDHIDRTLLKEAYIFHSSGYNRSAKDLAAVLPSQNTLTNEQVRMLQKTEHVFGGELLSPPQQGLASTNRLPSAPSFSDGPALPINDLLSALSSAFGESPAPPFTRPYPSGGAMYSGQVTVFAKQVSELAVGTYHYLPKQQRLERLNARPQAEIEKHLFLAPAENLNGYSFFVLYSILPIRPIAKYGMRGYLMACAEVGSMYQSLIQQTERLGLRSRVWGGFADEALSISMGVDPRAAWPVFCHLVGRGTS